MEGSTMEGTFFEQETQEHRHSKSIDNHYLHTLDKKNLKRELKFKANQENLYM